MKELDIDIDQAQDLEKGIPLYVLVANRIRQLILDGEMSVGNALPSERRLTEMTGTSRVTVRKAISQLVDEGLLKSKRGAGTYIAYQIEQSGEELSSFTEEAKTRGEEPSSVWLVKQTGLPTEEEAKCLSISTSTEVIRLGRLRLADGAPLAIEHAVVPLSLLPDLNDLHDSLYEALRKNGNHPVSGKQKICASLATPTEAGLLSIEEKSEILRIERSTFLADGSAVEYTRSAYRGDQYAFMMDLHLKLD